MSVGIETASDLIADLEAALAFVSSFRQFGRGILWRVGGLVADPSNAGHQFRSIAIPFRMRHERLADAFRRIAPKRHDAGDACFLIAAHDGVDIIA